MSTPETPENENIENAGRTPYPWKDVVFWVDKESRSLQTYPDPLSKWHYHLHQVADVWLLEVWAYGGEMHTAAFANKGTIYSGSCFDGASFSEMVAAVAVMSHEGVDPQIFQKDSHPELKRIRTRWTSWLRKAPSWVQELSTEWS